MVVTLLLLGFVVATSLAGEVAQTSYFPKHGYDWYHTKMKQDARLEIGQTPGGHKFNIKIDYKRLYVRPNSILSCYSRRIATNDFQNIVQVYYDNYLLDTVMVPRIDKLPYPLAAIDSKIIDSFIPATPVQDVAKPEKIIVYYLFIDNICVKAVYISVFNEEAYAKRPWDEYVERAKCTRATQQHVPTLQSNKF